MRCPQASYRPNYRLLCQRIRLDDTVTVHETKTLPGGAPDIHRDNDHGVHVMGVLLVVLASESNVRSEIRPAIFKTIACTQLENG